VLLTLLLHRVTHVLSSPTILAARPTTFIVPHFMATKSKTTLYVAAMAVANTSSQNYRISIACDCCLSMMLLAISTHVLLSTCTGVGGCRWPILDIISCSIFASCTFKYNAPSSASTVDAATSLRITHVMVIFPFSLIEVPSLGTLPRKNDHLLDLFCNRSIGMMLSSEYWGSSLKRSIKRRCWGLYVYD
jgi:hypothetical protein